MNISQISFSAKIPIRTCQIYDKHDKKYVPATIYEHDGKDFEDVGYFQNLPGRWKYKHDVADDIEMKFFNHAAFSDIRFFSIETDEKPIGILEYVKYNDKNDVQFVETRNRNRYKYTGTTLLALAAQNAIKDNLPSLTISDPVEKAMPFYINKCGFEESTEPAELITDEKGMKKIIEIAERKTKGKLLNIEA